MFGRRFALGRVVGRGKHLTALTLSRDASYRDAPQWCASIGNRGKSKDRCGVVGFVQLAHLRKEEEPIFELASRGGLNAWGTRSECNGVRARFAGDSCGLAKVKHAVEFA